ncbi:MAG TPA: hypothetical protein VND98_11970 [Solirubrobacterales bacterium]|nr:hypothetical protein [Solirubrobacterales bacterium]
MTAAAHAYFVAVAARDYTKVCDDISGNGRLQIKGFLKSEHSQVKGSSGCAGALKTLFLTPLDSATASEAMRGTVSAVRVKGDTAIVLLRPAGRPPSYFMMKREEGAWRAVSLIAAIPLRSAATR